MAKTIKVNTLDYFHQAEPVEKATPASDLEKSTQDGERKNSTFHIHPRYGKMIAKGKLEEKFEYKSDFIEHIMDAYFKDKSYAQPFYENS